MGACRTRQENKYHVPAFPDSTQLRFPRGKLPIITNERRTIVKMPFKAKSQPAGATQNANSKPPLTAS
jgi:hypothetical protein